MHTQKQIPTGYRYTVRNWRNEVLASDVFDLIDAQTVIGQVMATRRLAVGEARAYMQSIPGAAAFSVCPVYSMGEFAPR
jgi:hypothetical protein